MARWFRPRVKTGSEVTQGFMIYIIIPTTKDRRPRLKELIESIQEHTQNVRHCIVVYENSDGGWVSAILNAIKDINGYCVLLGSDTIVEKDWLKNLWTAFVKAFPDGTGVAEPYNELHGDKICQHPLAHSSTIRKYLHPGYVHWYSDNEFTDRARADGKLIYVPEARIEHKHFTNGKAQVDETYKIVFNPQTNERDRMLYQKRKQNGFKD